ncbi:hypothetical protein ACLB90_17070 [Stenotrophomonas sp. LGBM10]|uniref:hypothetical protein n=1 Tax=Stenotrophomonas sp. LGBM10 TaxID=3390038 RepID=UPI00398A55F7
MRKLIGKAAVALVFAVLFVPTLHADPPPPPPCTGNPICIGVDGNGNLVVCGPSGSCIPLETSQPPLQD